MVLIPQRFYFDKTPINDMLAALALYSGNEFMSPTRSTIPLLSLLKDGHQILGSIFTGMNMDISSNLHLEFTVNPLKGRGIASHTDLMVISSSGTLAIEAKWTEPRYPTVGEWIKPGNRELVLRGWLDMLQPHSQRLLKPIDFSGTVYQMVHRAASACYKSDYPQLAYLHFVPDLSECGATSAQYQSDLVHLFNLLGKPDKFNFYLIEVEIKPTLSFEIIKSLPKASSETANTVRAALENGPLFEFKDFNLHTIKGV